MLNLVLDQTHCRVLASLRVPEDAAAEKRQGLEDYNRLCVGYSPTSTPPAVMKTL